MTTHASLAVRTLTGWLALVLLLTACTGSIPVQHDLAPAVSTIHVVHQGWHAGIVVRRADIPDEIWPEKRDFPEAEYLEIGWGDRDYYQARKPGVFATLKAALWPTDSVLHVVAFQGPVANFFPRRKVVTLPVSRDGLIRLLTYVDRSFDRQGVTPQPAVGHGLYGNSRFYAARDSFYLFSNCNRWVARAVRAAGYDIREVITTGALFEELEGLDMASTAHR